MLRNNETTQGNSKNMIQEVTLVDILKELYELKGKLDGFPKTIKRVEERSDQQFYKIEEHTKKLEKRIVDLEKMKSRLFGGASVLVALIIILEMIITNIPI